MKIDSNDATESMVSVPTVSSNPASKYEMWFEAKMSSTLNTIGAKQFAVSAREFHADTELVPIACDVNFAGTLWKFTVKTGATPLKQGYYIGIEFSSDGDDTIDPITNSGLSDGSKYPTDDATDTLIVMNGDDDPEFRFTIAGDVAKETVAADFITSLPKATELANANISSDLYVYAYKYPSDSDQRYKQEFYYDDSNFGVALFVDTTTNKSGG